MEATNSTAEASHHGLAGHEVVLLLETDAHRGLSAEEAADRLDRYGPNVLPHAKTAGPLRRFVRQFHNPLIYILLVAGATTAALGEVVDASVIFGVVLINAVVGFIQESKAEAGLGAVRVAVFVSNELTATADDPDEATRTGPFRPEVWQTTLVDMNGVLLGDRCSQPAVGREPTAQRRSELPAVRGPTAPLRACSPPGGARLGHRHAYREAEAGALH